MQFSAAVLFALLADSPVLSKVLRGNTTSAFSADGKVVAVHDSLAADCHKVIRRRVLGAAGVHVQEETVMKDGFWHVGCEKDSMYEGPPKGLGVSVVHYAAETPSEDRTPISPQVCFDFCRSKPNVQYFGLTHGRECYCTPYFHSVAGDDSICDSVCEGETTQMCGSMTKSNIYQMHTCGQQVVVQRMKETAGEAKQSADELKALAKEAKTVATNMQKEGTDLQKNFGQAGDTAASNLMQSAKQAAGELQHAAEAAADAASSGDADIQAGLAFSGGNAFDLNEKLETFEGMVQAQTKTFNATFEKFHARHSKANLAGKPSAQYYPILYFTGNKEQQDKPTTCSGSVIGKPRYAESADECAASCDAEIHSCVGFSHVGKLCFLLSDFKTAQFYMKCGSQVSPMATCMAKFSEFDGTTLKPDASGKCKQCLKTLTQADRCFVA